MSREILQLTAFEKRHDVIGRDFEVRFKIENLRKTPTTADTKLWVVANRCFKSSFCDVGIIAAGGSKDVQLRHSWYGGMTFETVVASTTYVVNENGKETARQSFTSRMDAFVGGLASFRPPAKCTSVKNINILLFGQAGAGKSSYLQSQITALSSSQHVLTGVTPIGSGSEHVTTTLRKFSLGDDFKITLWDTWGLTPSNYVRGELPKIIKGILPNKWDMLENMSENQDKIKRAMKRAKENSIHALFVFLPCSSLRNPKNIAILQPLLLDVKSCGLNPIFLLALADEEVKAADKAKFRANPNASFPEIEAALTNAAKVFSIPRNRISVSVPYTEEKERVFEIDRLLCKNLMLALQSADSLLAYQDSSEDEDDAPAYEAESANTPKAESSSSSAAAGGEPITLQYLIEQFKAGFLDAEEFKQAKAKYLK